MNQKLSIGILTVFLAFPMEALGITAIDSVSKNNPDFRYFPEGILIGGMDNGSSCTLLQAGFGIQFSLSSNTFLSSELHVSAFAKEDTTIPSHWISFGCNTSKDWDSGFRIRAIAMFNAGQLGTWNDDILQCVIGFESAYRVSTFKEMGTGTLGIDLFICGGIGYDFAKVHTNGFLNAGVLIADWLSVSCDVLSFARYFDPVINMGRLK